MSSVELHSGDYVARYNRKPLDRVRRLLPFMGIGEADEIADFGCGNGMLLQALGDRSGTYHGVDFSSEFIDSARQWAKREDLHNCRFYCEDIIAFCNRNLGHFDCAATLDFSEHVCDEEAIGIYSAIRKSLKPGGKLFLHTPNLDFFVELMKDRGILRQFPEHIAVRNAAQTVRMLENAGFAPEAAKVRHIAHYNVLKHLHPLGHAPVVGKYFRARILIETAA
jgi:2-polyprenyl-6-hydroxyphenyl methylase / 3-demethylubiquinone-9 3-methyltransferase